MYLPHLSQAENDRLTLDLHGVYSDSTLKHEELGIFWEQEPEAEVLEVG